MGKLFIGARPACRPAPTSSQSSTSSSSCMCCWRSTAGALVLANHLAAASRLPSFPASGGKATCGRVVSAPLLAVTVRTAAAGVPSGAPSTPPRSFSPWPRPITEAVPPSSPPPPAALTLAGPGLCCSRGWDGLILACEGELCVGQSGEHGELAVWQVSDIVLCTAHGTSVRTHRLTAVGIDSAEHGL